MANNKNLLIETKYILSFARKCILVFFSICLILPMSLDGQTPKIWPTEISFNYDEGGSSNDALTIKKDASSTIFAPEYIGSESSVTKNENCAYIKSQGNLKIKVKFNSNNSNMNYLVRSTVISGTGIGNICEMFVAPCDLNTTVFTIDIQGTIPSYVDKNTFTWNWEATALPINSSYCTITCTSVNTTHTFYTLLSTPQLPMAAPWTDVLDKACVWASGETSASGAAQKITKGIYFIGDLDGDIDYDWPNGACMYSSGSYNRSFALTSFLSEIAASESVEVNCSDAGNLFNIFASAVGLAAYNKVIWRNTPPYYFDVNQIDPIGSPGWNTTQWGYHQFGWYNNYVDDACIRVNYSSPIIPSNMSQSTYDNYLIGYYNYNQSQTGTTTVY